MKARIYEPGAKKPRGVARDVHDPNISKHFNHTETVARELLEAAPDAIVVVDEAGKIVLVNAQTEKLFGYTRDKLLNQLFEILIPARLRGNGLNHRTGFFADSKMRSMGLDMELFGLQMRSNSKLVGLRKDGTEFPVDVSQSPVETKQGLLVSSSIRDVTVRRHAQGELHSSEEQFRLLVNGVKDYAIFMLDPTGAVATWNPGAQRIKGYSADEIIGRHFSCFYPAEDLASGKPAKELESAIENGRVEDEGWRVRKDGSRFWANVVISALRDDCGRLRGFAKVSRDDTQRKAAERHLAQISGELSVKHRVLDSVVQGTTDLIYIRDLQHHFILANRACATLFGRTVEEMQGKSMRELLPNASYDAVAENDREIARSGATVTLEEMAEIGGVKRHFLTTKGPFRDAGQKIVGTIGISREITERKKFEDQLAAANKELEAFAYSVAHDLRAPLRHIDGFSSLLAEHLGASLDDRAKHFLDSIQGSAQDMGRMVDELLNLSRMVRQPVNLQATGLSSLVDEVLRALKPEMKEREIEWKIAELPFVDCDPVLVKQVFANFLSNALKFTRTRQHAVIEIGQKNVDGQAAIFVRDNGVGFSMKYADKLFGVFQRLHRQEDFEGTGVGLATSQRIVHKHGGRIWAEAELNVGAIFYFTLGPQGPAAPPVKGEIS
jgi:PAS domain S-box-containing protein